MFPETQLENMKMTENLIMIIDASESERIERKPSFIALQKYPFARFHLQRPRIESTCEVNLDGQHE